MSSESGQVALNDQVMARGREQLIKIVRACHDHFEYCQRPGCPGGEAYAALCEVAAGGPDNAIGALSMAVYYLATREDLLRDELEEMLSGGQAEAGLPHEPDEPDQPES